MYQEVYQVICDRLTELGIANVATALGEQPKLPASQVYLSEDLEIESKTTVIRDLRYAIQLTVGHSDTTGLAQQEAHTLLDIIRAGFAGWRPPNLIGIQGAFRLPRIRIESYKDHGSTVYLVFVALRAIPGTFAVKI